MAAGGKPTLHAELYGPLPSCSAAVLDRQTSQHRLSLRPAEAVFGPPSGNKRLRGSGLRDVGGIAICSLTMGFEQKKQYTGFDLLACGASRCHFQESASSDVRSGVHLPRPVTGGQWSALMRGAVSHIAFGMDG